MAGAKNTHNKTQDKGSDIMHNPGHLGVAHARPPEEASRKVLDPLTNREFLTTSRSLGYPSKSIAREEAKAKGSRLGQRSAK